MLSAVRIECRVTPAESGYLLLVDADDIDRAEAELRAYERENSQEEPHDQPTPEEYDGPAPLNLALAVASAMGAFYLVTGPRDPNVGWFVAGSADAARILEGELWRVVTALSLHADLTHLIGNLLFGTLFLTLAGRSLGPGVAFALALLAGSGGNLLNALLRNVRYVSAIGLHAEGMTVEESQQLFLDKGFQDFGNAQQQAYRGTYDPGYLSYTLGKLMINKLRGDWTAGRDGREAWGRYHDEFLSYGRPPISLIREQMLGDDFDGDRALLPH